MMKVQIERLARLAIVFVASYSLSACDQLPWSSVAKARDAVKDQLIDPQSAQFRNEVLTETGRVCGEVNAKNRMGGYTGFKNYWVSFNPNNAIVSNGPPDFAEFYRDVKNDFMSKSAVEKITLSCSFALMWDVICSGSKSAEMDHAIRQCKMFSSKNSGDQDKLKTEVGAE
jgi:hypothetical protein